MCESGLDMPFILNPFHPGLREWSRTFFSPASIEMQGIIAVLELSVVSERSRSLLILKLPSGSPSLFLKGGRASVSRERTWMRGGGGRREQDPPLEELMPSPRNYSFLSQSGAVTLGQLQTHSPG